jgi:hypothetical protein
MQRERPNKQVTAVEGGAKGRNERVGARYSGDRPSLDDYSKLTSPEPERWTIFVDGLPLI